MRHDGGLPKRPPTNARGGKSLIFSHPDINGRRVHVYETSRMLAYISDHSMTRAGSRLWLRPWSGISKFLHPEIAQAYTHECT